MIYLGACLRQSALALDDSMCVTKPSLTEHQCLESLVRRSLVLGVDSRGILESRWADFLVLNVHVILQALCQWILESTFPAPAGESQLLLEKFREFVQITSESEQEEYHRHYAVIANAG